MSRLRSPLPQPATLPDCQLFCRRLGTGGHSPCCEELITLEELVPSIDNTPAPKQPNTGAAMP